MLLHRVQRALTQLLDHVCQHLVLLSLSVTEHGIRKLAVFHDKVVDTKTHAKTTPPSEMLTSRAHSEKGAGKKQPNKQLEES